MNGEPSNANEHAENNRVGYQAAIEMTNNESDLIWSRFNIMLVVHGIFVAVIVQSATANAISWLTELLIPIVGLVLCVVWCANIERGFRYQEFYLDSAKKLETELHLPFPS